MAVIRPAVQLHERVRGASSSREGNHKTKDKPVTHKRRNKKELLCTGATPRRLYQHVPENIFRLYTVVCIVVIKSSVVAICG